MDEMDEIKKEIQERRERRKALMRKVEAVLVENSCTYREAMWVLDELSSRYRRKINNLADAVNISEIAEGPYES